MRLRLLALVLVVLPACCCFGDGTTEYQKSRCRQQQAADCRAQCNKVGLRVAEFRPTMVNPCYHESTCVCGDQPE